MTLRTLLLSVATVAGLGLATSMPAQAQDAGFYVGPDGVRVYVDQYGRHHRDRYYDRRDRTYYDRYRYRSNYGYRGCHNRASYQWRYGHRVRVVDRVCYNRWGDPYIADRDYYRIGW